MQKISSVTNKHFQNLHKWTTFIDLVFVFQESLSLSLQEQDYKHSEALKVDLLVGEFTCLDDV